MRPLLILSLLLSLSGLVAAEDRPPPAPMPAAALVAVPSFTGTLPDGTPVMAIIVIPAGNVGEKNAAWSDWEAQWPTRYQVKPAQAETP